MKLLGPLWRDVPTAPQKQVTDCFCGLPRFNTLQTASLSMKTKVFLLLSGIMGVVVLIARTQTALNLGAGPWTGHGGEFFLNRTSYLSLLYQSNILATPRWDPSQRLPVSLQKSVTIAREELRKLVPDDREWKLASIELASLAIRAPSADDAWYYRIRFEPTVHYRLNSPNGPPYVDTVQIAVDFAGRPGVLLSRDQLLK
jgi:hypothetical protein